MSGQLSTQVSIPGGFTVSPGEIFRASCSWAEKAHVNVTYFHDGARGDHLAAWEEPRLFADELRACFRPVR